jgi:type II secretory ATPase GspE/PulE/Tfp pilus assembly ATPase PilB-like protein
VAQFTRVAQFTDAETLVAHLSTRHGLLNPIAAMDLIREARKHDRDVVELLVKRNLVSETDLLKAVAAEIGVTFIDLYAPNSPYRPNVTGSADTSYWMEQLNVLPLRDRSGADVVATDDPTNPLFAEYVDTQFRDGCTVALAAANQIRQTLLYEVASAHTAQFNDDYDMAGEQATDLATPTVELQDPVTEWLNSALVSAVAQRASDLHFETTDERRLLVRYRIDGELVPQKMPLLGREQQVIQALLNKTQSIDTSNLREPQDGSFRIEVSGRKIDVRVAMIPTINGQKVVLRLLDPGNLLSLDQLGFGEQALRMMLRAVTLAQGLVITAGPTGSGKTTTLYALLQEVVDVTKNVITVENPIEYRLPRISQVPIRNDLGERSVTFARALRSILRLDPDVILVGEVRDTETARTALDAALTGHLVLTTLHAPSALGVFMRLIEMGVPPYLASEALTLAISQRLVRRLHSCRRLEPPSREQALALERMGLAVPETVGVPVGCNACNGRGFRGRVAVAEVFSPSAEVRHLVAVGAPAAEIERAADASGAYVSYGQDAARLLTVHETTVTEVVRAMAAGEL